MKRKNWLWEIPLALVICLIQLVPIYITLTVSLKPQTDMSSTWTMPARFFWRNFTSALNDGNLLRAFFNTAVITIGATFLVIVLGAMSAYPLARNPSRLNRGVSAFILSIMMVPALSLLVPLYVMLVKAHAVSTYWGIIPVHLAFNLPLAIFMYANFIRTIPQELDEAALIDGCSVYSIFWRIILPLMTPVTVSVLILTSVSVWNDYQYSLYFLQKPTMKVVTLSIASFFGQSGADPHVAAAAALMAIFPIMVVYLCLQKYFVKGMVEGAIK
jgi:raffinose/stachyose/melibiose transport system permease protein